MRKVEFDDLRTQRKRRIIDHDTAFGVGERLIVAVRPERTNKSTPVDAVLFGNPVRDGVVDILRRVAVVGRLFASKLLHEGRVLGAVVQQRHLPHRTICHLPTLPFVLPRRLSPGRRSSDRLRRPKIQIGDFSSQARGLLLK